VKVAILSPYPTFPFHQELGCHTVSYADNASWTVALADARAQRPDTEVHVLTESTDIPRTKILRRDNLALHFIKAPERFKTLTFWYFDRRRLFRELAEIQPDIVHGQGIENQYGDAAVRSPYRHLLTVHGIPSLSNIAHRAGRFDRNRIVEHRSKLSLQLARNVVIINPFIAEYLQLDPARYRLFHIPNAVSETFFVADPVQREPDLILAVGWIDRLKAHDILARALALLKRRGVTVRAKIIGPEGDRLVSESLRQYARAEQLDLELTGFLPPDEVAAWMRRCTLLVHPSRHDNAPVAVCEAMACGTPILAARVGGTVHLIRDGKTGWLFESANSAELADKLQVLLADAELRRRLGENARQYAREHFRPAAVAAQTRAAYETVLAGHGSNGGAPCAALPAN
jgi:glycosyltransferase involved in cell wall biosynthesis